MERAFCVREHRMALSFPFSQHPFAIGTGGEAEAERSEVTCSRPHGQLAVAPGFEPQGNVSAPTLPRLLQINLICSSSSIVTVRPHGLFRGVNRTQTACCSTWFQSIDVAHSRSFKRLPNILVCLPHPTPRLFG